MVVEDDCDDGGMTEKMTRRNMAVGGGCLPAGSSRGEIEDLPGGKPLPPQKPPAATTTVKRSSRLRRERAWDDLRWDFYLRFSWYSTHLRRWAAADRTTLAEADDPKRRRCFEKACGAYRAYLKRFENS